MKVLFLTIGGFSGINDHGIYPDLLREFARHGHEVYVVCSEEKRSGKKTWLASEEVDPADNSGRRSFGRDDGEQQPSHLIPPAHILHVRIGNITKTNLIEKGISTVMIGRQYESAIDKYFGQYKSCRCHHKISKGSGKHHNGDRFAGFDLIMYSTPPITLAGVVEHLKKRYRARTYLLLKDIFPQNAVDIGMMSKTGLKAPLYSHFRKQEKKLYAVSDRIGCMSPANVRYVLEQNPEVCRRDEEIRRAASKHTVCGSAPKRMTDTSGRSDGTNAGKSVGRQRGIVEVCPNSIEPQDMSLPDEERMQLRRVYGIPEDKTVFIYGGNLGKPQGIDFMLRCLHRVNRMQQKASDHHSSGSRHRQTAGRDFGDYDGIEDVFFLIVGSGTEYGRIERYIEKYKPDNIMLKESLPKEDYDRIVAACDVGMIFLDHRFTIPNFPSRLLSYMQAKVPVLAVTDPNTDVGEVITGRASGIDMKSVGAGTTLETGQSVASDQAAGSHSAKSGSISEAEQLMTHDHPAFGWWTESNDVRATSAIIKNISQMDKQELFTMGENGYEYMLAHYELRDA
ncbi:MAG: glycosyltransferase family 4 protein [Eubacterium sp.]|nr:glycosyltransferase family 4 protein [Eubacterium sp.]